ncbi:MAG: integral rane protein [Frankiales bacterium]|nr:integral rane protein [Frankiales bacterium]
MTTTAPAPAGTGAPGRARIAARHLRTDTWWVQPAITVAVLVAFIIYSTLRAFENANYFVAPYISPFYSPCITKSCQGSSFPELFTGPSFLTPAIYILVVPLGFRLTCYYYRKAYYRAFWLSPPACAVAEPHKTYTGETRFPLVFQNIHRYFFVAGLVFNVILTYDAVLAFRDKNDHWGHMGLGTLVLLTNAALLWLYSLSCHSCRHIVGGKLKSFSKHPMRYKFWQVVSRLNGSHMKLAWVSLFGVALTDFYVRLLATGAFNDPKFF